MNVSLTTLIYEFGARNWNLVKFRARVWGTKFGFAHVLVNESSNGQLVTI